MSRIGIVKVTGTTNRIGLFGTQLVDPTQFQQCIKLNFQFHNNNTHSLSSSSSSSSYNSQLTLLQFQNSTATTMTMTMMNANTTTTISLFFTLLLLISTVTANHGVFNVKYKFDADQQRSLSVLKAHDYRRQISLLTGVDLPLGGTGRPDSVG
jgi:hypothetical protein